MELSPRAQSSKQLVWRCWHGIVSTRAPVLALRLPAQVDSVLDIKEDSGLAKGKGLFVSFAPTYRAPQSRDTEAALADAVSKGWEACGAS